MVTGGTVTVTTGGGHTTTPNDEDSDQGSEVRRHHRPGGRTITVDASDDALHSDGSTAVSGATVTLASGDDAVHAEDELVISNGTVDVTTSVEGLEAAAHQSAAVTPQVTSSDDGVNAAGGTTDTATIPPTDRPADQTRPSRVASGRPGRLAVGGGMGGGGEQVGDYSLTITGGTLVVDAEGDGLDSNGPRR